MGIGEEGKPARGMVDVEGAFHGNDGVQPDMRSIMAVLNLLNHLKSRTSESDTLW